MTVGRGGLGRRGGTLVEIVVSFAILALGATLGARVLGDARRSLFDAEQGLRALLLLSELSGAPGREPLRMERPAIGGRLSGGRDADGSVRIRFEPSGRSEGRGRSDGEGSAPTWTLEAPR